MKYKILYPGLDRVLLALKAQAKESVPFARSFLPDGEMSPGEIFNFLKGEVMYMNDPDGIELLQSTKTLFTEQNIHNIYGAGDCDCFTITALACLYAKGYRDIGIYLVGRSPSSPVHIYAAVYSIPFDLTNDRLGQERNYPYKQHLQVKF